MAEFEQPDIPKPKVEDPQFWGKFPQVQSDWLRAVAPQYGFDQKDIEKLILGFTLHIITGDDDACVAPITTSRPDLAEKSRHLLLARLDWETGVSELPDDIRERLKEAQKVVKASDWSKPKSLEKARRVWLSMRDWVKQQKGERPELKEAENYYHRKWRQEFQEPWVEISRDAAKQ